MIIRTATDADIPALVVLLSEDSLGGGRESADLAPYRAALAAIAAQPGNDVLVGELDGAVVACLQLTFIRTLSRAGTLRAQIEGVRVRGDLRGRGHGEALMRHAIARARDAGCTLMQLTTDRARLDAHRFYERLGFVGSHVGMKLAL